MAERVFNVATGSRYPLLELADVLNDILGTQIESVLGPDRSGDIKHSQADISLIKECSYQEQVDFRAGLAKTIEWYADHRE